jgi:hypothetical protein
MDIAKLASLLAKKALFFPSPAILAKDDKFEGQLNVDLHAIPAASKELVRKVAQINSMSLIDAETALVNGWKRAIPEMLKVSQRSFINSWHMNDDESDAMWKIYSKNIDYGVAIRTSYQRLQSCFQSTQHDVFIGMVTYIDYRRTKIDWSNDFNRYMHKREAFSHEREVRAICSPTTIHMPPDVPGPPSAAQLEEEKQFFERALSDGGVYVAVDLDVLVESIVISPRADRWFSDAVGSLVETFGLNCSVLNSRMNEPPELLR